MKYHIKIYLNMIIHILAPLHFLLFITAPIPKPPQPPSDFPRPDIIVNCLADGVQVTVSVVDPNFHGVMYVKGHSNDRNCLRTVEQGEAAEPLDFSVKFDTCGLFHSDVSCLSLAYTLSHSYNQNLGPLIKWTIIIQKFRKFYPG